MEAKVKVYVNIIGGKEVYKAIDLPPQAIFRSYAPVYCFKLRNFVEYVISK